jgi:hypothetical protein
VSTATTATLESIAAWIRSLKDEPESMERSYHTSKPASVTYRANRST